MAESWLERIRQWFASMRKSHRMLLGLTLAALVVVFVGFCAFPQWRVTLSMAAVVLLAILGLAARFVNPEQPGGAATILSMIVLAVVLALINTVTTRSLLSEILALRKTIELDKQRIADLKSDLVRYARVVSETERGKIVAVAGAVAGERFQGVSGKWREEDYLGVKDVVDFISALDKQNGHGLYFLGEVERKVRVISGVKVERTGHGHFYRYIEREAQEPKWRRCGPYVSACASSRGFCNQRTAWVNQLLAYDFRSEGLRLMNESPGNKKNASEALQKALEYTCTVYKYRKDGFNKQETAVSTRSLEDEITRALASLGNKGGGCGRVVALYSGSTRAPDWCPNPTAQSKQSVARPDLSLASSR